MLKDHPSHGTYLNELKRIWMQIRKDAGGIKKERKKTREALIAGMKDYVPFFEPISETSMV
ncbi:MAG: hypothetical protein EOL88_10805 [Bacteroidia bacterium]|nr:hypothetical protein [Bacteroidia bacterium]